MHSGILVPSLWRVFLITLPLQTDISSLTTVDLDKGRAFREKKTVHTKSASPSPPSFLDITPALQQYLQFIVSFTHLSNPNTKSPFSLHTTIPPFLHHYHSFFFHMCITCLVIKHSFIPILLFHRNCRDQSKCCIY